MSVKCKNCGTEFEGNFCSNCGSAYSPPDTPNRSNFYQQYMFKSGWRTKGEGQGRKEYTAVIENDILTVQRERVFTANEVLETPISDIKELQKSTYFSRGFLIPGLMIAIFLNVLPTKETLAGGVLRNLIAMAIVLFFVIVLASNRRLKIITSGNQMIIDSASRKDINQFVNDLTVQPSFSGVVGKSRNIVQSLFITAMIIFFIISIARVFLIQDMGIQIVKESSLEAYPNQTVGEAFDNFFSSPNWERFVGISEDKAVDEIEPEDGLDIVEFTGSCNYQGNESDVLVQFIVDEKEKTFRVGYVSLNNVYLTDLETIALFDTIFGYGSSTDAADMQADTEQVQTIESQTDEQSQQTKQQVQNQLEPELVQTVDVNEYIIPNSDTVKLTESQLKDMGLSSLELRLARNEIYARHGRRFNDSALQDHFDSCSWYNGTIAPDNFSEDMLNSIEKANIQTISNLENGTSSSSESSIEYDPQWYIDSSFYCPDNNVYLEINCINDIALQIVLDGEEMYGDCSTEGVVEDERIRYDCSDGTVFYYYPAKGGRIRLYPSDNDSWYEGLYDSY